MPLKSGAADRTSQRIDSLRTARIAAIIRPAASRQKKTRRKALFSE